MIKYIALVMSVCMAAPVWANNVFSDDFNREDGEYSKDVREVGNEWNNGGPVLWAVQNEMLAADYNVAGEYVLFNRSVKTASGNGRQFELSGDVVGMFGGAWVGIAFNYQDHYNFYAVRFQAGTTTYQFVRIIDGRISAAVSQKDALQQFTVGAAYTIKVFSDKLGQIDFQIMESGTSAILNPVTAGNDHDRTFKNGYAGFYVRSAAGSAKPDALFDNFSLIGK